MALSLHAATIPSYLQILHSVRGLIDKAEAFCRDNSLPESDLIEARLAEDMFPFAYQVKSAAVHSQGAIEGLRKGVFSPDRSDPPARFEGLRQKVSEAIAVLQAVDPAELDGFVGRAMRFEFGDFAMDFVAEDFLFSFSQPNFYFHAATAYDILRMKGLDIGKRDFIGALRLKG